MEVKQGPQEWRAAKTVGAPANTANSANLIPENCTASVIAAPHHRQRRPPTSSKMGKVHGSLARAGKVKSQTPKVEKQEKKKTPKGRAKKRIIYNRRRQAENTNMHLMSFAPI
ncbi:uncharacterized protein STEHIDRAFT_110698 [Stereum hirsutum FP-91666 SS1]|uniref:uncharacterized protein n=1 Tax=Stereum hirsutum (strain FP-91666) TaxID=721885 RepID=UPI000440E8E7|nr:uncharacterized protein STEHIDRAFT_110698 [Stereum hirsutum FP-91666 SS1]EIM87495.1 hypothetical protein STEHIDRAFT_110698 [Stereum hirsutum FP-91666 SS1]